MIIILKLMRPFFVGKKYFSNLWLSFTSYQWVINMRAGFYCNQFQKIHLDYGKYFER